MEKRNAARRITVSRIFDLFLALVLVVSFVPSMAYADDDTGFDPGSNGEGSGGDMDGGGDSGGGPGSDSGDGDGGDGGSGDSGGSSGSDTQEFDYTGSYTGVIVADGEEVSASDSTYETTETDVNVALAINAGTLTLENVELVKSGDDDNGDNCNFYGVNSILLSVNEGSLAVISSSTLTATSEGSNGVFATDSATAYVYDVTISTSSDNSRGLDATYGGTIVAADVTITTQGSHCAGVATDRGGGYINVNGATISTADEGSPILYSTGDVEVTGVTGTATGSQIAGMEGCNTIFINDSTLTSTVTRATASDPVANGVIIYQSTSGDADTSTGDTATFQVACSTLSSAIQSGAMFYITNNAADIVLYDSTIDFDSSAANLLLAAGNDSNSWGTAGENGATVKLTAIEQALEGVIEADTISSVEVYLTSRSVWTGSTLISENSDATTTVDSPICVNIDSTSTWVVTEDCTLSELTVAEGGSVVDAEGNSVTIVAGGQTVVEGTSNIVVTVTGTYSTDYDSSGEGTLATELIDRSGFDETFDTSTEWAMGDTGTGSGGSDDGTDEGTGDGTGDGNGGNATVPGDGTDEGTDSASCIFTELSGTNRYGTMKAIALAAFSGQTSDYAVIATGTGYADALAAASLAGALDAPIVLVNTSDATEAIAVIDALEVEYIYVVGGTGAVSEDVVTTIEDQTGVELVERLAGSDRYGTALAIAAETQELTASSSEGSSTVAIVATGTGYADALSISPYSYWSCSPVFLAGSDGTLSEDALAAIEEGGFETVVIAGGTSVVSSKTYEALYTTVGTGVTRLSGSNRYGTATAVAEWCVEQGMAYDGCAIATGENFPDALCAATLCDRSGSVLLLAKGQTVSGIDALAENASSLSQIYYLGGTGAVSTETRAVIEAIFE